MGRGRFAAALVFSVALTVSVTGGVCAAGPSVKPPTVADVPATIPVGGVYIGNDGAFLKPATPGSGDISLGQAYADASQYADEPNPQAVFALVVSFGNAKSNVLQRAWIVTYTSPRPTNINYGCRSDCKPDLVRRFNVVLAGATGKFLFAFPTK